MKHIFARHGAAFLLAALMILAGCAKPESVPDTVPHPEDFAMTGEKLAAELVAAMQEHPITQGVTTMEMAFSVGMQGLSVQMNLDVKSQMLASYEPYGAFSDVWMDVSILGEQITETMQTYVLEEDGELVSYTHADSSGVWEKQAAGMSLEEANASQADYSWLTRKAPEELLLEAGTQRVGGYEVYVLRSTLNGQELQLIMEEMGGMQDLLAENELESLDLTALSIPSAFYVEKDTFLLRKVEMDIRGLGEMLKGLVGQFVGEQADSIMLEVSVLNAVFQEIGYDRVVVPSLPEEARVLSEQPSDLPDLPEGSFLIREAAAAAIVTKPDGWTATESAGDYVVLERDDANQWASFVMYVGLASADFAEFVEQSEVPTIQNNGIYIAHGVGETLGAYETRWIECDGVNLYYAWSPMGTGWILICMAEYTGLDLSSALTPLLEIVEEY